MAAAVAASALVAVFDLQGALAFLLVVAAPAWILPTFAVLPRYAPPWRRGDPDVPARTPIGAVVTLAAALGALAGLAGLATLIIGYSGYEAGLQALIADLTPAIEQSPRGRCRAARRRQRPRRRRRGSEASRRSPPRRSAS